MCAASGVADVAADVGANVDAGSAPPYTPRPRRVTPGAVLECERVSRCGKKYRKIGAGCSGTRCDNSGRAREMTLARSSRSPGATGLRAAQDCRMRVSSATALRSKHASPLANAPSLSPETVRRGGERDRCGISLLRGSNPVTTRIVRRVSRKQFAVLDRGSDQHFQHKQASARQLLPTTSENPSVIGRCCWQAIKAAVSLARRRSRSGGVTAPRPKV